VLPGGPLAPEDVFPILDELLPRIYEASGIDFSIQERRVKARPSRDSSEGRIYYRGPRVSPSPGMVKLDLNAAEKVVRPPVLRSISHPFSDAFPTTGDVRCYSFDELFAEKIRALGERTRPRDLYDVINVYRRTDLKNEPALIHQVLVEKCETKGVPVPTYDAIKTAPAFPELETEWENMLGHQLPTLPPWELYFNALYDFFEWLEGRSELVALPNLPTTGDDDVTWTPPATAYSWGQGVSLEPIRFAGANHLCVEIDYRKANGQRTQRLVEPYSLRRTKVGKILLHTHDRTRNDHKSYRIDRLLGVKVTSIPFSPRYVVELTAVGDMYAPPTARGRIGAVARRAPRSRRSHTSSSGPKYIIECSYCGKRFTRKKLSTKLNKHKDKSGYQCPGRTGYHVDTRH
jgi:predicted nucleotidyltransferase component of viral defense system